MTNLTGRFFKETWIGMTVTSHSAQCEKVWKVLEKNESGNYNCLLISSNTAMSIPKNYTSEFPESEITEDLLPVDNWYSKNNY